MKIFHMPVLNVNYANLVKFPRESKMNSKEFSLATSLNPKPKIIADMNYCDPSTLVGKPVETKMKIQIADYYSPNNKPCEEATLYAELKEVDAGDILIGDEIKPLGQVTYSKSSANPGYHSIRFGTTHVDMLRAKKIEVHRLHDGWYLPDDIDLFEFLKKWGKCVQLSPPGCSPCPDNWFIWLSSDGRFGQR